MLKLEGSIALSFNLEECSQGKHSGRLRLKSLFVQMLFIRLRDTIVMITRGIGLPDIKYSFIDENELRVTVVPKGAGCENMSVLRMMNPSETDSINNFILETVFNAGGKPCPPIIVGVGIGGSFDKSAILAKTSLLREVQDYGRRRTRSS